MKVLTRHLAPAAIIAFAVSGVTAVRADAQQNAYVITPLVSDLAGKAAVQDPNLKMRDQNHSRRQAAARYKRLGPAARGHVRQRDARDAMDLEAAAMSCHQRVLHLAARD